MAKKVCKEGCVRIEQTLDLGWQMLSLLPPEELTRVSAKELAQYFLPTLLATTDMERQSGQNVQGAPVVASGDGQEEKVVKG